MRKIVFFLILVEYLISQSVEDIGCEEDSQCIGEFMRCIEVDTAPKTAKYCMSEKDTWWYSAPFCPNDQCEGNLKCFPLSQSDKKLCGTTDHYKKTRAVVHFCESDSSCGAGFHCIRIMGSQTKACAPLNKKAISFFNCPTCVDKKLNVPI